MLSIETYEPESGAAVGRFEELRVITLRGDWDVANRVQLREVLLSVGTDNDVLLDLRKATFFDSTALAEVIALYKRLTAGGRKLETLVGDSNMRRLLELTSLDHLLGITPERGKYLTERLP